MTKPEFCKLIASRFHVSLKEGKDLADQLEHELSLTKYPSINGEFYWGKDGLLFDEKIILNKIKDLVLSEEDMLLMEKGRKYEKLSELLKDNL